MKKFIKTGDKISTLLIMTPLISICIPAYKNAEYLETLLKSVRIQRFRDFQVIITDDSPDSNVEVLCKKYAFDFPLQYCKNQVPAGSPANWNAAIKLASGKWIKIMHDDDWFSNKYSLGRFAEKALASPDSGFIFSGYSNFANGKLIKTNIPGSYIGNKLKNPLNLIARNYIGHPSTTLINNNLVTWFDERTKWIVDIEFYIRCLQTTSFTIIPEALINIGINAEQITNSAFRNSSVEIPENLYLLQKLGAEILNNISVYDHYWRLFRNLEIRRFTEIQPFTIENKIPKKLEKMLKMQFKIPLTGLRVGAISKILMAISYYTNKN